ncbi:MAG TPA: hypothetical protein VE222_07810 [Nitrospiraceae bacterium]|nr:hypothetical protein [Nitrospiraceae bacterium]
MVDRKDDWVDRLVNAQFTGTRGWRFLIAMIVALTGLLLLAAQAFWSWVSGP